jgi:protein-L-isoaspartate(D-aspartate) O-methyltransferase
MRKRLVQELREKGIKDETVLKVIEKIPRHLYIDPSFEEQAYENNPFPIGCNQTISNPYTVAYQTQLLNIKPGDKVLEIGTGSGYQAAVLAELGADLYTIERHKPLSDHAKKLLKQQGYRHIKCSFGDGFAGLPEHAPFDKILITAAAPEIPEALMKQLAIGGVLVIPLGEGDMQQMLRITRKDEKRYEKEKLDYFTFVPMLKGTSN